MVPRVLQELIGWLYVLPGLAGVLVCALSARRSGWIWLLMGGFAAESLVAAAYRVATLLLSAGQLTPTTRGGAYVVVSLRGRAGRAAVVGGLAGLLSELGKAPRPALAAEP